MTSPFGPCCCDVAGTSCCHCDSSPTSYIIDLGAGIGLTNDRCNQCTGLAGEFILPQISACIWQYIEEDFCTDSNADCSDNYRLRISLEITNFSQTECTVFIRLVLKCNTDCTDEDPPCDSIKGVMTLDYGITAVLKTDIECETDDFPFTVPFLSGASGIPCNGSAFGTTVDIKEP